MTQDISPEDLRETARDFRDMGNRLTTRVLLLQNELGDILSAGGSQDDIDAKREEIDATSSRINQCFTRSMELNTKAALGILTSTDVTNAVLRIGCVTSKVRLAVDKLNQIRSALRFVAVFIDIGAAIATLGASNGVSPANIRTLIENIEALSQVEDNSLSQDDINQLRQACL